LPKFCSIGAATIATVDVEVRNTRVNVERWGEEGGKPLFYWHGGGGGSEETALLAPLLVEAGYTLYAVEAPGYGESPALDPGEYALPGLAALGADLLDTLGLAPAIWVGYSWGASIGVHAAARFPGLIRALALLDGGYLVAEDDPDYNPDSGYDEELADLRRRADEGETWDAPVDVVGAAVVASRNAPCPPLYPLVRKSGVPVLLAHATEPRELQPLRRVAIERFRTALPQARLVPIPNATHSVLQDNGPGVIRVLLAWLDELG
jgi:pimeloyl-ACP methyl ester carboxylesterase